MDQIVIDKMVRRGKVRDIYDLDDSLILVSTDRISAFDIVFNEEIQDKGKILNAISNHWFGLIDMLPNHIIETNVDLFPAPFCNLKDWQDRSVWVKKVQRIDFECIVRGYLLGSAFKEYQSKGSLYGRAIETGLSLGSKFSEPIFTPTTKSDHGHDENISFTRMQDVLGEQLAISLRDYSVKLYNFAFNKLHERGILLLDTKFEFGLTDEGVMLIDEVLTPDSSRFCSVPEYEYAMKKRLTIPSMDKQIIRDYLDSLNWDKTSSKGISLPENVLNQTKEKYLVIKDKILSIV